MKHHLKILNNKHMKQLQDLTGRLICIIKQNVPDSTPNLKA